MNAIQCLNNTEMKNLSCGKFDEYKIKCSSTNKSNVDTFAFQINTTDLYTNNMDQNETNKNNSTENWNKLISEQVNDCLKRNDTYQWNCMANSTIGNLTDCNCYLNIANNDQKGDNNTQSLVSDISSIILPYNHEKNNSQIIKNNYQNNHFDTDSELNNTKQYEAYSTDLYSFVLIFLAIYFISVFICWIFRNQIRRMCTCQKNEDDTIPLTIAEQI